VLSSTFFIPPSRRADLLLFFLLRSKRGTIYGLYDLSEQIGVSPWFWWSDVRIPHQETLSITNDIYVHAPPSVKYRGFFLNDEQPSLTNWAVERYGTNTSAPFQHEVSLRSSSCTLASSFLACLAQTDFSSLSLLPSSMNRSTS